MDKINTIVYKTPGKNPGPNGKTYDWVGVNCKDDLAAKLKDGWCETLAEACGLVEKPPTRKELEEKAKELKLKFDGRMKDATLLDMITKALKD